MAEFLNLDKVKKHLNVDSTFTGDDDYIGTLMDVAEDSVRVHLDRPLWEIADTDGNLPPAVVQAMLLMVGNLYANREPVSVGASLTELPLSYRYLISLYQKYAIR